MPLYTITGTVPIAAPKATFDHDVSTRDATKKYTPSLPPREDCKVAVVTDNENVAQSLMSAFKNVFGFVSIEQTEKL